MAVPQIEGFDSRALLKMAAPRKVSRLRQDPLGVALHYYGPAVTLTRHSECRRLHLGIQRHHMNSRRFHDYAYNGAVCPHGYGMAGRGVGVRSAANGTTDGNLRWLALLLMIGQGQTPTPDMMEGASWMIRNFRDDGDAGDRIVDHQALKGSTECAGNRIRSLIDGGAFEPEPRASTGRVQTVRISVNTVRMVVRRARLSKPSDDVKRAQALLTAHGFRTDIDGKPGPHTESTIFKFQRAHPSTGRPDGICGPRTWTELETIGARA